MAVSLSVGVVGLVEVRESLKGVRGGLKDIKELHLKAADFILSKARPKMPDVSGTLKAAYQTASTGNGARIFTEMPWKEAYSGVQEFGGTIRRHASPTRTQYKPHLQNAGSYFVYPAEQENMNEIQDIYGDGVSEIMEKHGL